MVSYQPMRAEDKYFDNQWKARDEKFNLETLDSMLSKGNKAHIPMYLLK
jgi:hypothetical protein